MADYDYDFVVKNADHFKALGMTNVYISNYGNYKLHPWYKADAIGSGASWRMDIPVSVTFSTTVDGITMCWSFDLEDREANGSGTYRFDRDRVIWVFDHLNPEMKKEFAKWLDQTAYSSVVKLSKEILEGYQKNRKTEELIAELVAYGKDS